MAEVLDAPTSFVLLEERFEEGDDRFLDEVLRCVEDKKLKALASKWYRDKRPFARRTLLAYVDDGCDRPRHRALVKALLNLAEDNDDDELMAHFLCAFDRLVTHEVRARRYYHWQSGETRTWHAPAQVYPPRGREHSDLAYALRKKAPKDWRFNAPWFSNTTRRYLRRRAYRWFRQLAYREPERYFAGLTKALPLYRDEHLPSPIAILDRYGLTNLLYYGSDVLQRDSYRIEVAEERQLAELEPAPRNPDAWRGHADELLRVLFRSDCLFVRRFLVRWLEREEAPALRGLDVRKLRPLLLSEHGDVALFAAKLLQHASGLATMPIAEWMELLELDHPDVLPLVCALVEQHVSPDRLDLAQLVRLASARPQPVAALGLDWLRKKASPRDAESLHLVMQLADAPCEPVRKDAVAWLLELVRGPLGAPTHLRDLLDARHADVRALAIATLEAEPRFRDDPLLWRALAESPYPDALAFLIRHLEAREAILAPERVEHAWATTLLSVHRGSHQKRAALRQIAARIVASPERADALLPILRVALRSVREAERRSALAAVSRAAFLSPPLAEAIARHVPELRFAGEVCR